MDDCATVTVPCPVTVAARALAPGHLGELTRYLPFGVQGAGGPVNGRAPAPAVAVAEKTRKRVAGAGAWLRWGACVVGRVRVRAGRPAVVAVAAGGVGGRSDHAGTRAAGPSRG